MIISASSGLITVPKMLFSVISRLCPGFLSQALILILHSLFCSLFDSCFFWYYHPYLYHFFQFHEPLLVSDESYPVVCCPSPDSSSNTSNSLYWIPIAGTLPLADPDQIGRLALKQNRILTYQLGNNSLPIQVLQRFRCKTISYNILRWQRMFRYYYGLFIIVNKRKWIVLCISLYQINNYKHT